MANNFLLKSNDNYIFLYRKNLYVVDSLKNLDLKDFKKIVHRAKYNSQYVMEKVFDDVLWFKVFHLDSLIDILKISSNKCLIELFDIIIYLDNAEIYKNCRCLQKRYIESLDLIIKQYINKREKYIFFDGLHLDKLFRLYKKIIKEKNQKDSIIYYNKFCNTIHHSNFVHYSYCNIYENINFPMPINLCARNYSLLETGYRSNESKRSILSHVNFGRFMPIHQLNNITKHDFVGIPVYESVINTALNEHEFSIQGGKGFSQMQSMYSAIGEGYERYCARSFGYEKILVGKYEDLKGVYKLLSPKLLNLDKKFFNVYNDKMICEWIEGLDLYKMESTYIPANAVFFPYERKKELYIMSQSTTGIAAGTSLEEAILQGILEVIERDSYSLTHKAKLKTKDIIINDENLNKLILELQSKGIKLHIKLLQCDLKVYVVHVVSEDTSHSYPIYTHGSGASLDINTALKRAIAEALQLRISQIMLKKTDEYTSDEYIAYRLWGEGHFKACETFIKSYGKSVQSSELKSFSSQNFLTDINNIVTSLFQKGYNTFCVNLTRNDSLLNVVRIIIPGYQDIDNYGTRDTERLRLRLNKANKNIFPMFN